MKINCNFLGEGGGGGCKTKKFPRGEYGILGLKNPSGVSNKAYYYYKQIRKKEK